MFIKPLTFLSRVSYHKSRTQDNRTINIMVFINKSAAKRILETQMNRNDVIIIKVWVLNSNTVCVRYRVNREKLAANKIVKRDLFLYDALRIRRERVVTNEWTANYSDTQDQAVVQFKDKDEHLVTVMANHVSCSCADFEHTADNEFGIPAICAHTLAFAVGLGYKTLSECVRAKKYYNELVAA